MKIKKTIVQLLLALTLASSCLMAQGPPPFPPEGLDPATMVQHRVQRLTTLLSLTSTQQTEATAIFTQTESTLNGIFDRMKTAHDDLSNAIKKNDQAGIDQAATAIGNVTKDITSAHAKGDAAFYAILTPDQQSKFSELEGDMGFAVVGGVGMVKTFHSN